MSTFMCPPLRLHCSQYSCTNFDSTSRKYFYGCADCGCVHKTSKYSYSRKACTSTQKVVYNCRTGNIVNSISQAQNVNDPHLLPYFMNTQSFSLHLLIFSSLMQTCLMMMMLLSFWRCASAPLRPTVTHNTLHCVDVYMHL